jgi:quercetin dioxygenase-like cupin family protein
MRYKKPMLALATLLVAGGVVAEVTHLHAQARKDVTRKELSRNDLTGIDGYDGVMWVTEMPPGGVAPRHQHPGYEFNYVTKGAFIFKADGQEPVTVHAGEGYFNQRGQTHMVSNASETEPAQLIVVLVHQKGEPLVVPQH